MKADMHVHTVASDGLFTPEDVAENAIKANLGLVVVTDHDTVFNTQKFNTVCEKAQLKTVSGIEISAYVGDVKIHTLGYGFNPGNSDFQSFLNQLCQGSYERTEEILKKLKYCGVPVTFEEASAERISDKTPIHAMHIARAGAKKGYSTDPVKFYMTYMMYGKPAFVNICRPSPEEAIQVINSAGGTAVIAHPGRIDLSKNDLYSLIVRLSGAGLGGIEAVYSAHTDIQTAYFREIAGKFGLLVTGGSDTHFGGGNRRVGSPEFHPSEELLKRLKIC